MSHSLPQPAQPAQPLTLVQAVAQALLPHATQVFGLMGNGNAHLIDNLTSQGATLTEVRHETATVAAADAYTRITGKLAIATTTYGAGFTNMLTALAEAAQARTPMLVVVGDAPSAGLRPWDVDQEMLAAALGVRTYLLNPNDPAEIIERAVASTLRNRRPIVLSLPYDLVNTPVPVTPTTAPSTAEEIDLADPQVIADLLKSTKTETSTPNTTTPATSLAVGPHSATPERISEATALLRNAKHTVIIAGRGAVISDGATAQLAALATHTGALTATTALARNIFPEAQYDLGITGGFGQEAAMGKISEADTVLVVGASLNQFTMRFGELFGAGTTVIRIDHDEVAPPRTAHPITHHLLQGDAAQILAQINAQLDSHPSAIGNWRENVTGLEPGGELRIREGSTDPHTALLADGRLDPRSVATRIGASLPENRHVTSDGGHFIGWANMYWPVSSPERMIMVGTAYQTIGLGFSTVAGVAAAAPDTTVVVTTGDGGGLMSLADLETTIRTTRSCVIVVWNDGAYGAEVHLYGRMGLDETPMRIPDVNFAGLASALGATGVSVTSLSDLDRLDEWREAGARGTILLDCRISRSVIAPYQYEVLKANGVS